MLFKVTKKFWLPASSLESGKVYLGIGKVQVFRKQQFWYTLPMQFLVSNCNSK